MKFRVKFLHLNTNANQSTRPSCGKDLLIWLY